MNARSVRLVDECRRRQWAAGAIDDGDPAAIGRRVTEAAAALADPRARLHLLPGGAR